MLLIRYLVTQAHTICFDDEDNQWQLSQPIVDNCKCNHLWMVEQSALATILLRLILKVVVLVGGLDYFCCEADYVDEEETY